MGQSALVNEPRRAGAQLIVQTARTSVLELKYVVVTTTKSLCVAIPASPPHSSPALVNGTPAQKTSDSAINASRAGGFIGTRIVHAAASALPLGQIGGLNLVKSVH